MQAHDPLLSYYQREISYLRQSGQIFAKKYPKIARRLDLDQQDAYDPHVDRLIQSFAFLTAKLSHAIDDRLKDAAQALLQIIYPFMMAPTPSMATAQFQLDPLKAKLTTGFPIPKGTTLWTKAEEDITCQFKTIFDQTLWPITISQVSFESSEFFPTIPQDQGKWLLKISLRPYGVNLSDLNLTELVLHLTGEDKDRFALYNGIFNREQHALWLSSGTDRPPKRIQHGISPMGFNDDELSLPINQQTEKNHILINEWTTFPEKFLFMKMHLDLREFSDHVDILIPLSDPDIVNRMVITKNHFALGCVPIINLFDTVSDPLKVNHQKSWYRLTPDQRQQRTTEIYSVNAIYGINDQTGAKEYVTPYFSFRHRDLMNQQQIFWHAKRISTMDNDGTDIDLSFVDLSFNPHEPQEKIIYAETTCTNRYLAQQIPAGGVLFIDEKTPPCTITLLNRPTPPSYTPLEGDTMWRLISLLSVNYLFFLSNPNALAALKEALNILGKGKITHHLESLKDIYFSEKTIRMGDQTWKGFVTGVDIGIKVDLSEETDHRYFLLGSIIQYFLSSHISVNSFTQLNFYDFQTERKIAQWKPLHGEQELL